MRVRSLLPLPVLAMPLAAQPATQPAGALSGRIVFIGAGHGWTFANESTSPRWYTQRGVANGMVEDYGNLDQMNREVSGTTSDRVYVNFHSNAGGGRGFGAPPAVTNALDVLLTDVPAGSTAFFRIAAVNAEGESAPSAVVACRWDPEAPRVLLVDAFDRQPVPRIRTPRLVTLRCRRRCRHRPDPSHRDPQ